MVFQTKRLFPTFIPKGTFAFVVPRRKVITEIDVKRVPDGVQLYNVLKESIVKIPQNVEIDRQIYIQDKRFNISINGKVINEQSLPKFISSGVDELDKIVEDRFDKLRVQLITGVVDTKVVDMKLKSALEKNKDIWGIDFHNVSTQMQDADEFNDNDRESSIIYM